MVAKAKGTGDSPAAKARKTTSPLRKTPAKTHRPDREERASPRQPLAMVSFCE
jgi:hypothetical protein